MAPGVSIYFRDFLHCRFVEYRRKFGSFSEGVEAPAATVESVPTDATEAGRGRAEIEVIVRPSS
jgi:hypothetical protein